MTTIAIMAVQNKHEHVLRSLLMVVVFLAATAFGSFVMMGVVSPATHRSQGQLDLPYSQREVWHALLDVDSRSQFEAEWSLVGISSRDREGALVWEAETGYGKICQFKRVATHSPSRVVLEGFSPERNSRTTTEFRLESLGNGRTRVIATQTRETQEWFDRSLLVLHGMNHSLQNTFGYLKTYFANAS